jgi:predicted N-acetyltransferase YhbS
MTIIQAERKDLQEILNLQYLAYQSEAKLCNNPNIPPLTQKLSDLEAEFDNGIFLKALDGDTTILASVRAYSENGTLYIGKLIVRPDLQGQGIGQCQLGNL